MTDNVEIEEFPFLYAAGGFTKALRYCLAHPRSGRLADESFLLAEAGKSPGSLASHKALQAVERSLVALQELDRIAPAETDPHGKDLNSPGAKADAGKLLPDLVLGGFARALNEVSKVGTYGAKKYTKNGWMEVPDGIERYTEAMLRHWLKERSGEECDPDTDLRHAAHLAWNALARLDLMVRESEKAAQQVHVVPTDFLKATNR